MNYKLVKGNIIKSDFAIEYEPNRFNEALIDQEKKLKEVEAQKKIYEAKSDNVLRNHPHVLKLDEEKRNAVWLFHENFVAAKQVEGIIKQLKKNIKGLKSEMDEITKQTGLKFE